ncbi:hypothetical protein ACFL4N_05700 [Thermodesulfobacteriota bacterium]
MSKRYLVIGYWLLVIGLLAVGCGGNQVGQSLADYVNNEVLPISELERRALASYASVVGKNYTSDEAVYEALKNDVLPLYKRFLDGLKRVHPTDKEVRGLHGVLLSGAESMYEGFRLKMIGLEQKDESIIRAGNSKIEKGRAENVRWRKELVALAEKHKVGMKEDKKKTTEDGGQTTVDGKQTTED